MPRATGLPRPERGFALVETPERGFALIEMLVAMLLLSLVGLTLARFQSFQLSGTANVAAAAAARLEADNRVIDVLAAPRAPLAPEAGTSRNAGRDWRYEIVPGPSPDPVLMPDLVTIDVRVSAASGPVLVSRRLLRPRAYAEDPKVRSGSGPRPEPGA
jgi:type II secretion system protein I